MRQTLRNLLNQRNKSKHAFGRGRTSCHITDVEIKSQTELGQSKNSIQSFQLPLGKFLLQETLLLKDGLVRGPQCLVSGLQHQRSPSCGGTDRAARLMDLSEAVASPSHSLTEGDF